MPVFVNFVIMLAGNRTLVSPLKFKVSNFDSLIRDATIVTTIDTFTSLLAGSTVFGILGHLAYKVSQSDNCDRLNF